MRRKGEGERGYTWRRYTPGAHRRHRERTGVTRSHRTRWDERPRPLTCACGCDREPNGTTRHDYRYNLECWAKYRAGIANRKYQENYNFFAQLMGNQCLDCDALPRPKKKFHFVYWAEPDTGDTRPPGRFMQCSREKVLRQFKWCDLVCHSCDNRRRTYGTPQTEKHQARRQKTMALIDVYLFPYDGLRMDGPDNTLEE